MSPRKTVNDEFDDRYFSADDNASGKERKRQKSTRTKKKKNSQPTRSEYEFDTDFYDDFDDNDYLPDYEKDDWEVSYNPPYTGNSDSIVC